MGILLQCTVQFYSKYGVCNYEPLLRKGCAYIEGFIVSSPEPKAMGYLSSVHTFD